MEPIEYSDMYRIGDIFWHKDDPTYKIKIIHVDEKAYDFTTNTIQQYYCIITVNNNFSPPSCITSISLNTYYVKFRENKAKIP